MCDFIIDSAKLKSYVIYYILGSIDMTVSDTPYIYHAQFDIKKADIYSTILDETSAVYTDFQAILSDLDTSFSLCWRI